MCERISISAIIMHDVMESMYIRMCIGMCPLQFCTQTILIKDTYCKGHIHFLSPCCIFFLFHLMITTTNTTTMKIMNEITIKATATATTYTGMVDVGSLALIVN